MKRRCGELCSSNADGSASCSFRDFGFRTRRFRELDFLDAKCGDRSCRQYREHRPRHDMEREEYSSSLEMDINTLPKTKARRRRKYLGIIRRTASLTIATVAFSPIAGAFDAIPSAALVHKKGRNFSTSHRRNLRNLQGDIQQCKIALAVGDINRDEPRMLHENTMQGEPPEMIYLNSSYEG